MDFLLSSSQLRHILSVSTSRTKFRWVDVCAINELPRYELQKSRPTAFIVNSDPNFKPGKHWTAIYFPRFHSNISNAIPEFFDPYGLPPLHMVRKLYIFSKLIQFPNMHTILFRFKKTLPHCVGYTVVIT